MAPVDAEILTGKLAIRAAEKIILILDKEDHHWRKVAKYVHDAQTHLGMEDKFIDVVQSVCRQYHIAYDSEVADQLAVLIRPKLGMK